MSDELCDLDSQSLALAMQRKLERFYDKLKPVCVTTLGSIACLEIPVHYLEVLNKYNSAAVRCQDGMKYTKTSATRSRSMIFGWTNMKAFFEDHAIFLSSISVAAMETIRCTFTNEDIMLFPAIFQKRPSRG
jgi:hypothetical protein